MALNIQMGLDRKYLLLPTPDLGAVLGPGKIHISLGRAGAFLMSLFMQ